MLDRLKGILSIWLLKYWYLLLLSISLSVATFYYFEHEGKARIYEVKMMGSTLLLSRPALQEYLNPLSQWVTEKDYTSAQRILGIPKEIFERIGVLHNDAQTVIEEQYIRYEYTVTITALDTTGFYVLEDILTKYLRRHILVQDNFNNKTKAFEMSKALILKDIRRIDSTAAAEKNPHTDYYETLQQKKVDFQLQLSKLEEKYKDCYTLKKIYGFKEGTVVFDRNSDVDRIGLVKWTAVFLLLDFMLVLILNKELRQIMMS